MRRELICLAPIKQYQDELTARVLIWVWLVLRVLLLSTVHMLLTCTQEGHKQQEDLLPEDAITAKSTCVHEVLQACISYYGSLLHEMLAAVIIDQSFESLQSAWFAWQWSCEALHILASASLQELLLESGEFADEMKFMFSDVHSVLKLLQLLNDSSEETEQAEHAQGCDPTWAKDCCDTSAPHTCL
eukprot:5393056-Amphidinium_carterae.1